MNKSTSVFLDGLRFCAALVVFANHCVQIMYADRIWTPGDAAVIAFFVLSGYVIAYTTLGRGEVTAKKYILARLSRLYSVVIPALLLTASTMLIGVAFHLQLYDTIIRNHDALRFVCIALFLQSIWGHNFCPQANGPFWSLSYEFWYYAIFGCLVFIKKGSWKVAAVLGCCLIVGGNILLLFPTWLLGTAIYLYGNKVALSRVIALPGFVAASALTLLGIFCLPEYPEIAGVAPMYFSADFLTAWLEAVGIGAVIWFFGKAFGTLSVNPKLEKVIRWPAERSFSLYLFHMPLIIFFQALGIFNPYIWWNAVIEIGLILAIIAVLAEVTESKRKPLQKLLTEAWNFLERRAKA